MTQENNEFKPYTDKLAKTLYEKNKAYGASFDHSLDDFGLEVSAIRLGDKYRRLKHLVQNKETTENGESIKDTLLDMAGYAILTLHWLDNKYIKDHTGATPGLDLTNKKEHSKQTDLNKQTNIPAEALNSISQFEALKNRFIRDLPSTARRYHTAISYTDVGDGLGKNNCYNAVMKIKHLNNENTIIEFAINAITGKPFIKDASPKYEADFKAVNYFNSIFDKKVNNKQEKSDLTTRKKHILMTIMTMLLEQHKKLLYNHFGQLHFDYGIKKEQEPYIWLGIINTDTGQEVVRVVPNHDASHVIVKRTLADEENGWNKSDREILKALNNIAVVYNNHLAKGGD